MNRNQIWNEIHSKDHLINQNMGGHNKRFLNSMNTNKVLNDLAKSK